MPGDYYGIVMSFYKRIDRLELEQRCNVGILICLFLVVIGLQALIDQDLICFGYFNESIMSIVRRIDIRVIFFGQLPVGLFDFFFTGIRPQSQDFVIFGSILTILLYG